MRRLSSCAFMLAGMTLVAIAGMPARAQVVMDRASTAGESYARGASDIIRSRGAANLDNSQANINNQDAYSAAIDNSVKSVNAYWERRDIYNQRQAQKNYERGQRRERHLEKTRLQPLTSQDFDRTTGQIGWPGPLKQDQYSKYRDTLNEMFQRRAEKGALSSDDYMTAMTASKQWRTMLTKQRDTYPRNILSQMVRFILKIDRELDDNLS